MKCYRSHHQIYKSYLTNKGWNFHNIYEDEKHITVWGFHSSKTHKKYQYNLNVIYEEYLEDFTRQNRVVQTGFFINLLRYPKANSRFANHSYTIPIHRRYQLDGKKIDEDWIINGIYCTKEVHDWFIENNIQRPMTKADHVLMKLRFG